MWQHKQECFVVWNGCGTEENISKMKTNTMQNDWLCNGSNMAQQVNKNIYVMSQFHSRNHFILCMSHGHHINFYKKGSRVEAICYMRLHIQPGSGWRVKFLLLIRPCLVLLLLHIHLMLRWWNSKQNGSLAMQDWMCQQKRHLDLGLGYTRNTIHYHNSRSHYSNDTLHPLLSMVCDANVYMWIVHVH